MELDMSPLVPILESSNGVCEAAPRKHPTGRAWERIGSSARLCKPRQLSWVCAWSPSFSSSTLLHPLLRTR